MSESLVLGIVIFALWVSVAYLRVPATILFLSILVGKLFAEELSVDVYGFINGVVPGISTTWLQAGLLILPVVLTVIFLKGSVAKSSLIINAIPLLFCLVTLGLFINPYFDVVSNLDDQQRIILTDNQSYIVSLAGLIILLSAWLPNFKPPVRRGKRHR